MNSYSNTQHILDLHEDETASISVPHTQFLIARLHEVWAPPLEDLSQISQSQSNSEIAETQLYDQGSPAE